MNIVSRYATKTHLIWNTWVTIIFRWDLSPSAATDVTIFLLRTDIAQSDWLSLWQWLTDWMILDWVDLFVSGCNQDHWQNPAEPFKSSEGSNTCLFNTNFFLALCVCVHFVLCVYFIMISAVIINAAEMLLFFLALCVRVCLFLFHCKQYCWY